MNVHKKWTGKDKLEHNGAVLDSKNGFDVIDCYECGFKHIVPIPSSEELEEVYQNEYYSDEKPLYIDHYLEDKRWWDIVYKRRFNIFEKHLDKDSRKILDIGSGPGLFLLLGQELGWSVKGIEPSSDAAKYSREKLGLDIDEVFFDINTAKEIGTFDVINMGEVLEHLPHPSDILKLAHATLNDDGLICLIVPNDYNPFQLALQKNSNYESWWVSPPHHINYFDQNSLRLLVENCGYKVLFQENTFPIDMFLMMGKNYVGNDKIGRSCHSMRKEFEMNLSKMNNDIWINMYGYFTSLGLGRESVIIARKISNIVK